MLNKCMIIGRIGKDPEIRHTNDGKTIANLSVATSEKYKDKTGKYVENTEWHNVSVFGVSATYIEKYAGKGNLIYVEGKIKTDKYTDKTGVEKYSTKIMVNGFGSKVDLLGGKNDSQQGGNEHTKPASTVSEALGVDEDDIPF